MSGIRIIQAAKRSAEPAGPNTETKFFDLGERTPLELIRKHTKTDDIPRVTDEQLQIYREAAFEAAEQYTGFYLRGSRMVTETLSVRASRSRYRPTLIHRMQYPVSDGLVYIYGQTAVSGILRVNPGARKVTVQLLAPELDLSNCCSPCGNINDNGYVMYRTGFDCMADIPAGIILGVLKCIAWNISNPGDQIATMIDAGTAGGRGVVGSNNLAWASGALALWRSYSVGSL